MNTRQELTIPVTNGVVVKSIPAKMLTENKDKFQQVFKGSLEEIIKTGLTLRQIVQFFRGNILTNVGNGKLECLVAAWIGVWKEHGRF